MKTQLSFWLKKGDHRWKVFQLQKKGKKRTSINSISKDDESLLKRLIRLNEENVNNKGFEPGKKTFKKFLKMKGFENKIELIKVSNNE